MFPMKNWSRCMHCHVLTAVTQNERTLSGRSNFLSQISSLIIRGYMVVSKSPEKPAVFGQTIQRQCLGKWWIDWIFPVVKTGYGKYKLL